MNIEFEAKARITVEPNPKTGKASLREVNVMLELSDNLVREHYFGNDGMPNYEGGKALTNTLVQGILGNIHSQHQAGIRDSAEHLRYVMAELERGFVEVVEVSQAEY